MKAKTYKDSASYLRKCWRKYDFSRERQRRKAAEIMGYPSYIMYLERFKKLNRKYIDDHAKI